MNTMPQVSAEQEEDSARKTGRAPIYGERLQNISVGLPGYVFEALDKALERLPGETRNSLIRKTLIANYPRRTNGRKDGEASS